MIVAKLTQQQADELRGKEYTKDSVFNPIQDANDNWVISLEEVEQCDIKWVKELPLIEYEPKQTDNLI